MFWYQNKRRTLHQRQPQKTTIDKETANYIINYFSNLMTADELLALKYHFWLQQTKDNPQMRKVMFDRKWTHKQPDLQAYFKDGYEAFEINIAKRIMQEMPEKVFLNYCPKCNKLARTPQAKQCRHCGYQWRNLAVAQFITKNAFQMPGKAFYLLGQITKGEIKEGQWMDLTPLGLNKKAKIEAMEHPLSRQDGNEWGYIGLGTNQLTDAEKELIKRNGLLGSSIDILNA